jgi:hypothetical protein
MHNTTSQMSRPNYIEAAKKLVHLLLESKWVYAILLICGLVSAILSLIAYAPADGADGGDYYLHAALLAGEEAPAGFALHPPLLPLLIFFFRHGLGQIYGLIILQALFSIIQGVLFYRALSDYDRGFAFISAVLISFDMQTKVLNSFISTEPLYIFLLSLSFCLLLLRIREKSTKWLEPKDWLLGLMLALLYFTRAVGRFLILPFGLSFLLFTRSWKRSLVLVLVYIICMQTFYLSYDNFSAVNKDNLVSINSEEQWSIPLFRGKLLDPQNGPASSELFDLATHCEEEVPVRCLVELNGQNETLSLINLALRETVIANPFGYGLVVLRHFSKFLSLSGQQYRELSPAQTQCTNVTARTEGSYTAAIELEWLSVADTTLNLEAFRQTLNQINGLLCPPWYESETIRGLVDTISNSYSVIALPRAYLLYGVLLMSALFLPYFRRYLPVVLSALLMVFYHAGVSSLIFNVQSRYVVVTNPYRILLFLALVYLVIFSLWGLWSKFVRKPLN